MELLFAAICAVESGGEPDPLRAVGKDGLSFGPAQITDICRRDVNRIAGTQFTREDCFSLLASKVMFGVYIDHYATHKRLGHTPTDEDRARIWNSGPNGWRKQATIRYWGKVHAEMVKQRSTMPDAVQGCQDTGKAPLIAPCPARRPEKTVSLTT